PVVSRGDARSARARSVAGAAPAEVVLRLPHALAGQRAGRALGTFGAQRKIEIESARYRARRGDAFARQEVVRVAGSLRDVVDAADRARRAGVPGRARARPLATHRAAAILHDAPRAHLLGAGDVDVGEQLHVARALAGRQIERVRDRRVLVPVHDAHGDVGRDQGQGGTEGRAVQAVLAGRPRTGARRGSGPVAPAQAVLERRAAQDREVVRHAGDAVVEVAAVTAGWVAGIDERHRQGELGRQIGRRARAFRRCRLAQGGPAPARRAHLPALSHFAGLASGPAPTAEPATIFRDLRAAHGAALGLGRCRLRVCELAARENGDAKSGCDAELPHVDAPSVTWTEMIRGCGYAPTVWVLTMWSEPSVP